LTEGESLMKVSIRCATLDDLPTIMRICLDPQVQPNQYRVDASAATGFRMIIAGEAVLGRYERCISSIEVDGVMAGYIHHDHSLSVGAESVTFGWNLAPSYWGQGIMPAAVNQLVDWCIAERTTKLFVAECFRDNQRCIRVIEKLGFQSAPISYFDRFVTSLAHGNWKWVLRYELDLRQATAASRQSGQIVSSA
jgi:RimJ/RimL family protein N-acetyltransferase